MIAPPTPPLAPSPILGPIPGPALGRWERRLVSFGGTNQRIVGSTEGRKTRGVGLAFERTDRYLTGRGWRGSFQFEGSYVRSLSDGEDYFGSGAQDGFQLLGGVRFSPGRSPLYLEILSGGLFTLQISHDLTSWANFAPTLGVGGRFGRFDVGVRFSHVSNADTHLPNNGLNLVSLVLGARF